MSKKNDFEYKFEELAKKYSPHIIAEVGEIVLTKWGDWKHSHKVKISEIGIQLVTINSRGRKDNETLEHYRLHVQSLDIELYYIALRLNKDGNTKDDTDCGICLTNFIKKNGEKWVEKGRDFNHIDLSWTISSLSKQ